MNTDRIEKRIQVRAPLTRVWDAVSDSARFGSWFGVAFDGPFEAGKHVAGKIVPTTVDPEVAKLQQPHAGKVFEFWVERIALLANEGGWEHQTRLIQRYLSR